MTEELYDNRRLTEMTLTNSLNALKDGYMKVYDEYHNDSQCSRDCIFIHDLVDCIQGIVAITTVYARDGVIHPDYVLEKLDWSKSIIEGTEHYFKNKLKEKEEI